MLKSNTLKWLLALILGLGITGCQKVPTTPMTMKVKKEKSTVNLHTLLQDVVRYKEYAILQDNNRNTMIIKFSKYSTWSISYKVVNTNNDYTVSYLNSTGLDYKNGKIHSAYKKLITSIHATLNKCLSDPQYYVRLKQIVVDREAKSATSQVQPVKQKKATDTKNVSEYDFFAE